MDGTKTEPVTCGGDALCARCLAVHHDDASEGKFVKVVVSSNQRVLFFSENGECSSRAALPAEWQTRAEIATGSDDIARGYFPPIDDYLGLFVVAICLLPWHVLADGQRTAPTQPPRLLILGGGGGVLAQLYAQALPSAIIDVVESSSAVLALAQRYFGLRCGRTKLCCHRRHARAYARQYRGPKYDLIALDAFENGGDESATPRAWSRRAWCGELTAMLHTRHGVLVANLYAADETSAPFRANCDSLRSGGSRVIFQPGRWPRTPGEGSLVYAAQTVEAWGPAPNLQAGSLEAAARALQQSNPAVAPELSARALVAWCGQVPLGGDTSVASATLIHPRSHRREPHYDHGAPIEADGWMPRRSLLASSAALAVFAASVVVAMTVRRRRQPRQQLLAKEKASAHVSRN